MPLQDERALSVGRARPALWHPAGGAVELEERFHRAHEERYGYADRARVVELVTVRTADVRPGPQLGLRALERRTVSGPELVDLEGATCWVPEGWAGETDRRGTLVLERER